MKEADEMQRSLAMRGKDQRPSLILRQEIVECGCYIPIGGAQRHLRFLLACQESAEGRLPVAGRPYLACIVERAGLPLNEEPGPVRRFLVVERRITFRAFQIGRRVNEENRSLAASVRSHACGCPERRVVLPEDWTSTHLNSS